VGAQIASGGVLVGGVGDVVCLVGLLGGRCLLEMVWV
jgi:hypothetical protein